MTERKTLKDLPKYDYTGHGEPMLGVIKELSPVVSYNELRTEAIKWIKKLQEECELRKSQQKVAGDKREVVDMFNHTIGWIKYFFNLMEEDLKW